jgi:hypothetical protein
VRAVDLSEAIAFPSFKAVVRSAAALQRSAVSLL